MDINFPINIQRGTFSVKKNKDSKYIKGKIQRIIKDDNELIQISLFTEKQVFHTNCTDNDVNAKLIELLENEFNNLELFTNDFVFGYRITSKGKLLTNKRKNNEEFVTVSHNKEKNYIIKEGEVVPALVDLGVMTPDGRVVKASFDKFKQINRFLEMIDDSIKNEKKLKIIDFGCGKSYLTFILYHYLTAIKNIECDIIGLDLKEDVIDLCNKVAKKYNYDHLKFLKGNIADYSSKDGVDMIVTLHACDTATDYALYYAINMKCRYIFSVPCCQHEINQELKNDNLHFMNKYGILKERYSSLVTDAIRANLLEYSGYKTNVMEFVDFENSPKNLLIRATLTNNRNEAAKLEVEEFLKSNNINQKLYELMFNEKK